MQPELRSIEIVLRVEGAPENVETFIDWLIATELPLTLFGVTMQVAKA